MALVETLEAVKRRELAQRLDAGEAAVLATVAEQLPKPPAFDEQIRADLQPFISWTTKASVRYAPAKPAIVAAYVLHEAATGVSTQALLRRVNAISALHDHYSLADPVSTTVVRGVLSDVVSVEPPRSWNKAEALEFIQLPPEIKAAIHRRDRDREVRLRQAQNELAELKKKITATSTAADAKPVETSEKKEVIQ